MNVPMLASRVARRYASLRSAGLFDRDLVAKALKYTLSTVNPTTREWGSIAYADLDGLESKTKKVKYGFEYVPYNAKRWGNGWDEPVEYDTVDGEIDVELEIPHKAEFDIFFGLPFKLLSQVSPAQHTEFLLEVLNLAAHKVKPTILVETAMGGQDSFTDILNDDNSGVRFDVVSVEKATVSPFKLVQAARPMGQERVIRVKFKAVFDLDFGIEIENIDDFLPDYYDGPDPD